MKNIFLFFSLISFAIIFGQDSNFQPLDLNIPKSGKEPKKVHFEKNKILVNGKKCFDYSLYHNYKFEGRVIENYYEIKSLDNKLLFSGEIFPNENGEFQNPIIFYDLDKSIYQNFKIIGRNSLILNLASNQVLNEDCSINLENLRLFFNLSNQNNKQQ